MNSSASRLNRRQFLRTSATATLFGGLVISSATSDDLGFDLELAAWRSALQSIPRLLASRTGSVLRLEWEDPRGDARLESSPSLGTGAPWSPVPQPPETTGGSTWSIRLPVGDAAAYFRLVRP